MTKAAKIIGTGLATTGLTGAGVGIGVVLGISFAVPLIIVAFVTPVMWLLVILIILLATLTLLIFALPDNNLLSYNNLRRSLYIAYIHFQYTFCNIPSPSGPSGSPLRSVTWFGTNIVVAGGLIHVMLVHGTPYIVFVDDHGIQVLERIQLASEYRQVIRPRSG